MAGDSLLVMNSLLTKESMGGKVQMIYIDPPYGIKYGSNFQPFTNKRDVKDRSDADLTQEPEMIKAFRDTWELGIHSYLTYLRDRLMLARELLTESGSVFVQISDENLHHVRELMEEVFGAENYAGLISYSATTGQTSGLLAQITDYILWYGKDKSQLKHNRLLTVGPAIDNPSERYVCVETPEGHIIDLSVKQKTGEEPFPEGGYLGVTIVTRKLLEHWHDESARQHPFYFCQLEAIETLIWWVEGAEAYKQGIYIPGDGGPWERLCNKMATGAGKTTVMAMIITWQVLNAMTYPKRNKEFSRAVFIVTPVSSGA